MAAIFPVILCGGSGTRLWPVSRPSRPKQFRTLVGDGSLFEQTVARVAGLPGFEELIVVTGAGMAPMVREQLGDVRATVLLEPQGRDSAPAMAAAAAFVQGRDPQGICVFVASDHYIPHADAFRETLARTFDAAAAGRIVTLGITPRAPTTAYGYIRPAQTAPETVVDLAEFREKPDAETAQRYVDEGYLWNSGNFIAAAATLLEEFDRYEPEITACARDAVAGASAGEGTMLLSQAFLSAPKISVDYAVMERTERASVIATALDWSDVGAWNAVADVLPGDAQGNRTVGDTVLSEARGCYVRADGPVRVAVHGVDNLAVVATEDAVLVCPLDKAQAVKDIAAQAGETPPAPARGRAAWAALYGAWLREAALPLWHTYGVDRTGWGFHESLADDLSPSGANRRMRVQARQTWVFGQAARTGLPGPWADACAHGWAGLDRHYRREDGLYRTLAAANGGAIEDDALLYDQAFILLTLSVSDVDEALALAHLDRIEATYRHPDVGFRELGGPPYQSNAQMHLFEAAQAWMARGESPRWRALAEEIVTLALTKFIDDDGALHEFFAEDWSFAPGAEGDVVEPGHQYEWAWLLARWAVTSGDEAAMRAARRLYEIGAKGVDPARGVATNSMGAGYTITDPDARLWPQTERLKAVLLLEDDWGVEADAAAHGLWRYLDHPRRGLWYDTMHPNGQFKREAITGSSFYHILGAVEAVTG